MDAIYTQTHRYLDITILTTLPPNCVNRDDTGRPKTVLFGGAQRQSPSSQFLKRGWRRASITGFRVARSTYAPLKVAELLGVSDNPEARKNIAEVLYGGSFKGKKADEGKTNGLLFYGARELDFIAEALKPHLPELTKTHKDAKSLEKLVLLLDKTLHKALSESPHEAAIIALYGRMCTNTGLSQASDAALSVSRAMSTSAVAMQTDYFTAIDDSRPSESDEGAGAGFLGRKEFCSGSNLLLQYRINLDLLRSNAGFSGEDAAQEGALQEVVGDFIRTSLASPMPGAANQGVFATSPRTHAAIFRVAQGMPFDMAPAFLTPSKATDSMPKDTQRLFEFLEAGEKAWGPATATLKFDYTSQNLEEFTKSCLKVAFSSQA